MTVKTETPKPVRQVKEAVEEMVEEGPLAEFLDHQKKAVVEFRHALEALLPTAFKKHGKKAVEEAIEGYRGLFNSTVDDIVERVEKLKIEEDKPGRKN